MTEAADVTYDAGHYSRYGAEELKPGQMLHCQYGSNSNENMQPISSFITRGSAARYFRFLTSLFCILLGIGTTAAPSYSQDDSAVALLTGTLASGSVGDTFLLSNLRQGQRLSVHAEGTGGDLDPFVGLSRSNLDLAGLTDRLTTDTAQAVADGRNPLGPVREIAEDVFLTWDDDGGDGYAASFEWVIPQDGDYRLLVTTNPHDSR